MPNSCAPLAVINLDCPLAVLVGQRGRQVTQSHLITIHPLVIHSFDGNELRGYDTKNI